MPFLKRPIRLINLFRGLAFIKRKFLRRGNLLTFFIINIIIEKVNFFNFTDYIRITV